APAAGLVSSLTWPFQFVSHLLRFGTALALFISDSFRRQLPLIPPTSRFNIWFKVLASLGLGAQLIFELRNVERTVWMRIRRPAASMRTLTHDASSNALYRMPGSSFLSPAPIRTPHHEAAMDSGGSA